MKNAIAAFALLLVPIATIGAPPTVPRKYVGDWVAQASACDAPLRVRVRPTGVTLIDGAQSQNFEGVDVCLNCEARVPQGFEAVTLTPEAGTGKPPFKVRLYSKENKGLAVVSIEKEDLKASFALDKVNLRKCAQTTAQTEPSKQPPSAAANESQRSLPNVDVIGIKLGKSTVAQTRAALAAVTPSLKINELRASLLGRSTAGRAYAQQVPIPNSDYVSYLQGTTIPFQQQCQHFSRSGQGNCETITVTFSTPPSEGIAIGVTRQILFMQGPPLESTVRSLIEKYGQPGFHSSYGDRGVQQSYFWVWSESGKPVPLNAQHPCASPSNSVLRALNYWEEYAKSALQSGCAVIMYVNLQVNAGTVTSMGIQTADHLSVLAAVRKTGVLIAKGVAEFEQGEKAKAAKTAPPRL